MPAYAVHSTTYRFQEAKEGGMVYQQPRPWMAVALGYTWSPVMIAPPDATPPSEAVVARSSLMLPLGMPFVYRSYATVFSRPPISRASRHQKRLEILYLIGFFK